ncbi:MAG TPA: outer membrane lipoprotein-sorting protein [Verrucomicrobiae bacterium]|nr:outer membrane lipoprotein-sorting protein [Verrucomicrobiae bacterium]
MSYRMLARSVAVLMLLALAPTVQAQSTMKEPSKDAKDTGSQTVKSIRSCMAKNLVSRGALRDLSLDVFDKEGKIRSLRMRLFWKPSKGGGQRVNLRLVEPSAMAGSSYLLVQEGLGEEVYFYLPGADRALRITGQNMSEPLWGTDFSYGEIKQVLGILVVGDTTRLPDSAISDRPMYVLETATKADETGYRKVISHIDQKTCVLMRSEFYAREQPRKVLDADPASLLQADKYWTALSYTMTDVQRNTHTQLSLSDLSFDERMSEKLFDPQKFFEQNPK